MENQFIIYDIKYHDLYELDYHMEIEYNGHDDIATFSTGIANNYHKQFWREYDGKDELTMFMVYCSFLRDAVYACLQIGEKVKLYINIEKDSVYCLPLPRAVKHPDTMMAKAGL